MQIEDHLRQLEEKRLLDPAVRKNAQLVSSLLADDFIEFGSSGRVFNKASIIEDLKNEPPRPASLLSDFAVRPLAPEAMWSCWWQWKRVRPGLSAVKSISAS